MSKKQTEKLRDTLEITTLVSIFMISIVSVSGIS